MDKDLVPFWEEAYQDEDIVTFSAEPNATIKEFEYLLNRQSQIIDIGCGEGQNAFYLARQGYCNVDAFDISKHGIAKLQQRCRRENIQLNAFTADLTTYQFEKNYDMVMSFGTLHFVQKTDWKAMINRAKAYTNIGGIHIMQIFTDTVPASKDITQLEFIEDSIDAITTIGMLNRCINMREYTEERISILKEIAGRTDVDKEIKDMAQEFVDFQTNR